MEQKWKGDGKVMDEGWKGERKVNENKLMLREVGFVVLVIILFLQYFKLAAYLSDRYFFASYFWSYFVLFLGIPLSYFAAKYLVKVIKKVI